MIQSSISGVLYRTSNTKVKSISLELECYDDLLRLAKPPCVLDLRPPDGWRYSNEPEAHLNDIASEITEICPNKILCTSYKDFTLAKRIRSFANHEVEITTLFDTEIGLIRKPAEECLIPSSPLTDNLITQKYDLILCRHFLEHSPCPSTLIQFLSSLLEPSGSLYVEVPTIEKFLDRKVPLFIWEQHLSYFSPKSLSILASQYFDRFFFVRSEGQDIEPSLCALFTYNKTPKTHKIYNDSKNLPSFSPYLISLDFLISNYKKKWSQKILSSLRPVALLGIGHASDRFRQWTELVDSIDYYLDSDQAKLGLYLANSSIPISYPDKTTMSKINTLILGVHDRDQARISRKLRNEGFNGKIHSIYECPD